jgi:hypothetical protein
MASTGMLRNTAEGCAARGRVVQPCTLTEDDIQEIAMTLNLTPRKCLAYRSPVEAFLGELGRTLEIRFA